LGCKKADPEAHMKTMWTRLLVAGLVLLFSCSSSNAQVSGFDRARMRTMLNTVSSDIQKNFYDPQLKGLDWKKLTDEARQRIDNAKSMSEMITAIFILTNKIDDSHTMFLPPGRVATPSFGFDAKPFGDEVRVYAVSQKGPAGLAGLKPGDRLLNVNGFRVERSTFDLMMLDFRALRPRSELTITYQRGNEPPQTVKLAAKIKKTTMSQDIETTIWKWLNEFNESDIYHTLMFDDEVAYIEVPEFINEDMPMPHRFDRQPRAVVVDLRNDPGGYQESVLEMAGHFSDGTPMGQVVMRKKTEPLKVKQHKPNFGTIPIVVMIDSESSSAAEMFARYLQLTRKAIVVGDRSSARVNSSEYFAEAMGNDRIVPFGVQISTGKVVMSDGSELEKIGVTPDLLCLPSGDDLREGRDPCLLKALSLARKGMGSPEELPQKIRNQADSLITMMNSDTQKQYDHEVR
jgi:carboxyl-terminal processing protease